MVLKGQIERDSLKSGTWKFIKAWKEPAWEIGAGVDDRLLGDQDKTSQSIELLSVTHLQAAVDLSHAFNHGQVEESQLRDRFFPSEIPYKAIVTDALPYHLRACHHGPFALNPVQQTFGNQVENGGPDRSQADPEFLGQFPLRRDGGSGRPLAALDSAPYLLLESIMDRSPVRFVTKEPVGLGH
jgi:hypothetical protein